jgi:hypothetical protein
MMASPPLMEIINQLHSFSPRLFENQIKAGNYLKKLLDQAKIPYTVDEFDTEVPNIIKAKLVVDGQEIPCRSTSLVSGNIDKSCDIVDSSTTYSDSASNLNYNGKSDSISRAAHYEVPSLAFSRKHLDLIKKAKDIKGIVEIEPKKHTSQNIILGNTVNPTYLVFTHYDSLEGGAMDNASGTAITIKTILDNPKLLDTNLFIISSDEELSFDSPQYWGKGYRDFESKHPYVFQTCQKIYIIDGLGLTLNTVHQHEIEEYFPITNINKYISKTFAISCEELSQWSIYHSTDDTPDKLNSEYLNQGLTLVYQTLSS